MRTGTKVSGPDGVCRPRSLMRKDNLRRRGQDVGPLAIMRRDRLALADMAVEFDVQFAPLTISAAKNFKVLRLPLRFASSFEAGIACGCQRHRGIGMGMVAVMVPPVIRVMFLVVDGNAFIPAGETRHLEFGRFQLAVERHVVPDMEGHLRGTVRGEVGENGAARCRHDETMGEDVSDRSGNFGVVVWHGDAS